MSEAHEPLRAFIENLSEENKNKLALNLAYGRTEKFVDSFPEFEAFLAQHRYEFKLLWVGNNVIYQVDHPLFPHKSFVLKLESWSMPPKISDFIKSNEKLKKFLNPVYLDVGAWDREPRVQILSLCRGGSIEKVTEAKMTDAERIDNCIALFKEVSDFYRTLENLNPAMLFPDGKPSNFTLDEHNKLKMTDLKTMVEATASELETCSEINNPSYVLYIPKPPPRELQTIHSRHMLMSMYMHLTKTTFDNFITKDSQGLVNPLRNLDFSAAIFQTGKGAFLKYLIQAGFSDDSKLSPCSEEIHSALRALERFPNTVSLEEIINQLNPNKPQEQKGTWMRFYKQASSLESAEQKQVEKPSVSLKTQD